MVETFLPMSATSAISVLSTVVLHRTELLVFMVTSSVSATSSSPKPPLQLPVPRRWSTYRCRSFPLAHGVLKRGHLAKPNIHWTRQPVHYTASIFSVIPQNQRSVMRKITFFQQRDARNALSYSSSHFPHTVVPVDHRE